MQEECNIQFYFLISEIIRLETEYVKGQDRYSHLEYLLHIYRNQKENKEFMNEYKRDINDDKISELAAKIEQFDMDSTMKIYYDLYKEKSELLKKYWEYETEICKIDYRFIFDCIYDEEIDKQLANKRKTLESQQKSTDMQIQDITVRMQKMYNSLELKGIA